MTFARENRDTPKSHLATNDRRDGIAPAVASSDRDENRRVDACKALAGIATVAATLMQRRHHSHDAKVASDGRLIFFGMSWN